jgi:hypothetical protein
MGRYERHLVSPEWRALRDLILWRNGRLCQGCLSRQATEVHHKS